MDPDSAPRSAIENDPEYQGKEEPAGNDDQFVGQDSSKSDGSETEVVIKSDDASEPKELENETTKPNDYNPQTDDNKSEIDKPHETVKSKEKDKSPEADYGDNMNTKFPVIDNAQTACNTTVPYITPVTEQNGELNPYKGLCNEMRCQRPYTWYTTVITPSNMEETESSPKEDLSKVAQSLKEMIDLTRRGHDVKKRRSRHTLRHQSKNHRNNAKQKRRNLRKPSPKFRKSRNKKNTKRKKVTKIIKTQKNRKNTKMRKGHLTSVQ